MRTLAVTVMLIAVLTLAPAAQAGCWATVGLDPPPAEVSAGETWVAGVRVLQHGRTPLAGATPAVQIESAATGARRTVAAVPVDPEAGLYRAEVVFPAAGNWRIAVHDGFPVQECARTHTFGTAAIAASAGGSAGSGGGGGGSFPALAVGLGAGLGLLALTGAALAVRARRAVAPRVT